MARVYSRKKGQSGSSKPTVKKDQSWLGHKGKEVELLVMKLAKEGYRPSQIGIILRDTYGVPDVKATTEKTISQILAEKNLLGKFPEDLLSLMKRRVQIQKHMDLNKKDMTAVRGQQITDSKIRRLVKYYKKTGKVPQEWNYNPDEIKMIME